MSGTDTDSMWLQKSITLPDPMPDVTGTASEMEQAGDTGPAKPAEAQAVHTAERGDKREVTQSLQTELITAAEVIPSNPPVGGAATAKPAAEVLRRPLASNGSEMELTKLFLDTSGLVSGGGGSSIQRPSVSRYSTARASMSNAAFVSAHEYDEVRAKLSQAKRELLKVSDVQKDLDFARFELTRTQEELKMLSQSNQALRREVGEAEVRAERAIKAKSQLETDLGEEALMRTKEVDFLKSQIEELRQENTRRLADLAEQQETESQSRIHAMRAELAAFSADAQSMTERVEELRQEAERLQSTNDAVTVQLQRAQKEIEERERRISEVNAQLREAQEAHQQFISEAAKDRDEAVASQQALADRRVDQVSRSKDAMIAELKEELAEAKDKIRSVHEECAVLQNANRQLTSEVKHATDDHAKELRRLAEEHRLALCEKELQMESCLREAKGSRGAVEEERQALRRHVAKVSEELSTVAAVLAQRDKQLAEAERDQASLKERLLSLEQDNMQLANDAQINAEAAEEANERVHRINEQKDTLEEEYSGDLRAAKERVRALEGSLMDAREELSALRGQQLKASDEDRTAAKDLRAELEAMTEERNRLAHALSKKTDAEVSAEEFRKRYTAEKQKNDALNAELTAAMNRCGALEKRLDDELRRAISRAVTTTSPSSRPSPGQSAMRLRSVSSVNTRVANGSVGGSSLKRARTEDARVFAITGFDGSEVLSAIKQLPNVAIAECKSNMPVPSNLTHMITNGQLTIKLLTALVRGCWALPETYVTESLKAHAWLPETEFGFQHEEPPLLKKRVFVTDSFSASKHYSTASLLLREGGAMVLESKTPAEADIVLCTNHELADFEGNGMSWEKMVEMIYPQRIN